MTKRLCIDFGGTRIKIGLLDGDDITAFAELLPTGTPADLGAVEEAACRFGSGIDEVGVALPGIVTEGALQAAHGKYAWARGRDLRVWARSAFGDPHAVVENDARAALAGEIVYGAAAGAQNAVLVVLGTGIGTAAVMGGSLVRGRFGHAGILGGHLTVDLDGPVCNCGNVGCAEAVASTWALTRDATEDPDLARALGGAHGGLKALFDHADEPLAANTLERYLTVWGAVVVGMCHSFDPEVVILSGGALRRADVIVPRVREYVTHYLWSSSFRPAFIIPDAPERAVLRGLSALRGDHDLLTMSSPAKSRKDPR